MRSKLGCFNRLRRDERGQAFVEFAILLPVFLLMVLGMIDLSRAWNAKQVITDAAREAARNGVVDSPAVSNSYIEGIVATALGNAGFDPAVASVTLGGVGDPTGTQLTVGITYPYEFQFMSLFLNLVGGSTIQLQTQIVMRNE